MTFPTLLVDVGFTSPLTGIYLHLDDPMRGKLDTNTLAPDDLFTDVSQWVVSATIRRGATRADGPTLRYEAGTATIVLRNEDRRFDPTNLSGPYVTGGVTQVEPMRAVRVRATWNGITYPLFRGFADNWEVTYPGPNVSEVILTATDAFKVFASYDRLAGVAVGAGEDSGARINRILDSITWPSADRMVSTGQMTLQSTTLADNTLTELLLTADSELGDFYMDANGRPVFRDRLSVQTRVRSVLPQGRFGAQDTSGITTTVNLVTNPSNETSITGWIVGGSVSPTIAQSSTRAMFGSQSLVVTWGAGGLFPQVNYDITGLTVGRTYTFSLYVWVPTGSPDVAVIVAGSNFGTMASAKDQWVRLEWTGSAQATTVGFQVWPVTSPAGGEQFWVDGLQAEEGDTVSAYVDGDQTSSDWDGVPHASTSRRLPELGYADVEITYDDETLYNLYQVARAGGTEQSVEDAGSRTAYLTRSFGRSDLLLQNDTEVLSWAQQLLARTATPELRFSTVTLLPRRDPDNLFPQALGRDLEHRIIVVRRPPGGGSSIEREVWIRGIQHEITKKQWKTVWVLQKAPTMTVVSDSFGRTASNGWGTADTGQVWTVSGTAADYSVGSGSGAVSLTAVNTERVATLDTALGDVEALVRVSTSAVAATQPINAYIRVRTDASNFYQCRMAFNAGATISVGFEKNAAGVLSSIGSMVVQPAVTHTATTFYWLRVRVAGSRLRARAWQNGTAEPSTWTVDLNDSSVSVVGDVAVRAILSAGNTNALPVTVRFDDFSARSLYVWT